MANATSMEYATIDDQGLPNRIQMYVAYNGAVLTIDALIGAWLSFGALFDDCIDGKITGGQLLIPLNPDPSWKAAPVSPGSNSNQIMTLNFNNDFNQYATPIILPSYSAATLVDDRPNIDDAPLDALIAQIIAGTTNVFPNSNNLRDLNALRNAFLGTRKLKKTKAVTLVTP